MNLAEIRSARPGRSSASADAWLPVERAVRRCCRSSPEVTDPVFPEATSSAFSTMSATTREGHAAMGGDGWGARIRTWEWRYQKPLPYRLATPQRRLSAT